MVELYLIRHGKTYGNTLGRYIGITDESLCAEGLEALRAVSHRYPSVDAVCTSPLKRCIETAGILWPDMEIQCFDKLRECDFGDFENKNYLELKDNPDYQAWVDSLGTRPFPGGESREAFQNRCRQGFLEVLETIRQKGCKKAALVVHGGTIMSILEAYGEPKKAFYDWQVKNGMGYLVHWDEKSKGGTRLYEVEPIGIDGRICTGSDLR
ncbi:histidine phosphatase family protein [Candidatus Merdisoma sp. JLR.KK006]|uniref:histidine phosphatase family protein n=1 Tax=Candidatus Merdisoma sp. JLR.KK006 TaxID=3112626 RepID=UPI002FF004D5